MSVKSGIILDELEAVPRHVSGLKRFTRIFFGRKVVIFGMVVIVLLAFTATFAPLLAPYNPNTASFKDSLAQISSAHLLGTDTLGRDTLSRLIYGSQPALIVGLVAVSIAAIIGMSLGLLSGFYGGLTKTIIMRAVDALMSFPMIFKAVTIAAILGGGLTNVVIALGISLIPPYARLMYGQVLSIKQNDYITASRAIGATNLRIMLAHILPNCFPPLIVMLTMQIGQAILAEASLSFLGIGISPPTAAWGQMVSDGYKSILGAPMLSIAPGAAIMLVVFAFNMVGDGLRDALDPKLRGIIGSSH